MSQIHVSNIYKNDSKGINKTKQVPHVISQYFVLFKFIIHLSFVYTSKVRFAMTK